MRAEIAQCIEASYETLALADAQKLIKFDDAAALQVWGGEREEGERGGEEEEDGGEMKDRQREGCKPLKFSSCLRRAQVCTCVCAV